MAGKKKNTRIETITHDDETRTNIPTAEMESLVREEEARPTKVKYDHKNNPDKNPELYARNPDLDPQLVWKGKDEEDRRPLSVDAVPIYVQERIHPKAIIDDIKRMATRENKGETIDFFANWDGELNPEDKIEFYQHAQKWTNRMILGDSLQVMTSLADKEGLKGQIQCIYFDPPYGINFGSNLQPTTSSNRVTNTKTAEAREPEVIKAFRDTWSDGVNSYLSYIRDRMQVARDLLTESGSFFLQIGDANVHLLRVLMDEIFGAENFISQISVKKTTGLGTSGLSAVNDFIVWYSKNRSALKFRNLFKHKPVGGKSAYTSLRLPDGTDRKMTTSEKAAPAEVANIGKPFMKDTLYSAGYTASCFYGFEVRGKKFKAGKNSWKTNQEGMYRLAKSDRILVDKFVPGYRRYFGDFPAQKIDNNWSDVGGPSAPIYVVQTNTKVVKRCLLMATDPGDLVLDPTCGSGTTAYVAEQWGRRWITIDTSRVSLALARSRMLGSYFDYYFLSDSPEGAKKEASVSGRLSHKDSYGQNIREGFVYERVPHITLASIARNTQIDSIWERWQKTLEPLRGAFNKANGQSFEEWEVPREAEDSWSADARQAHEKWWEARIARQKEIDACIARNADTEYIYDRPYVQTDVVRVTGPFTVESLSPHRVVPTDADDEALLGAVDEAVGEEGREYLKPRSKRLRPKSVEEGESKFIDIIYENLRQAGVQNTKKNERMRFISLEPWPNGRYVQFEGRYMENGKERKAAICVGPEYGTVTRSLMVQAAREAADYFNILVVMGFAFEAHADKELINIGNMQVLRARMNNDLHMANRLKSGKSGNLFVVFGEPDIELCKTDDGKYRVEIKGIDIFDPTTGDVRASEPDDIACWFIDTDYNDEAFFMRHAYFSGGGPDPFKRLKTTLRAEINEEAWSSLYSTVSRPFEKPTSGRIAVKAINHFGDEVLKVFSVR